MKTEEVAKFLSDLLIFASQFVDLPKTPTVISVNLMYSLYYYQSNRIIYYLGNMYRRT